MPRYPKHKDEVLIAEYKKHGSVWKVGNALGMSGQQVHERLKLAGVETLKVGLWTNEQIDTLKDWYSRSSYKDKMNLAGLAKTLGKEKANVCRKARALGLTDRRRTRIDKVPVRVGSFEGLSQTQIKAKMSESRKNWLKNNPHPKGMLGKKHTDAVKFKLSMSSKRSWESMSKSDQEKRTTKSVITRANNNTPASMRVSATWKCGWREVGGQKFFARSRWEANIARYFEFQKTHGKILAWKHEPKTFWFEKIKRGVRSYKPDFLITRPDGTEYYCEVKGWMDSRSRTTIKRMRIYFPEVTLDVIDAKRYRVLNQQCKNMIEGWEIGKVS